MSELLQFIILAAFGALCFGGGYLTAFIVTRNHWRDEMIKRGVARYNRQTGEWGEPPKEPTTWGVAMIQSAKARRTTKAARLRPQQKDEGMKPWRPSPSS
jgi:hypothetical protein